MQKINFTGSLGEEATIYFDIGKAKKNYICKKYYKKKKLKKKVILSNVRILLLWNY